MKMRWLWGLLCLLVLMLGGVAYIARFHPPASEAELWLQKQGETSVALRVEREWYRPANDMGQPPEVRVSAFYSKDRETIRRVVRALRCSGAFEKRVGGVFPARPSAVVAPTPVPAPAKLVTPGSVIAGLKGPVVTPLPPRPKLGIPMKPASAPMTPSGTQPELERVTYAITLVRRDGSTQELWLAPDETRLQRYRLSRINDVTQAESSASLRPRALEGFWRTLRALVTEQEMSL